LNIPDSFSKNTQIIEFNENPPSGSRVVSCGQMDGRTDKRDEANSRLKGAS